jgi:hypothetical protein
VWSRIEHLRQNDAGKRTECRAQLVDRQPLIGQAFPQSSRSDLVQDPVVKELRQPAE